MNVLESDVNLDIIETRKRGKPFQLFSEIVAITVNAAAGRMEDGM